MEVLLQLVVLPTTPLNDTVLTLVPTVGPKFAPVIVTTVPTGPEIGLMLVILGGGVMVKGRGLLATPATVTKTLTGPNAIDGTGTSMLVALQLVGVAVVVPKVTALVPCVVPKFEPVIVIIAPMGPWVSPRVERLGPGLVTVKGTPLLATPPTVTTTLPVKAPFGTGTVMLEAPQLVGVAVTPLKVTVLEP